MLTPKEPRMRHGHIQQKGFVSVCNITIILKALFTREVFSGQFSIQILNMLCIFSQLWGRTHWTSSCHSKGDWLIFLGERLDKTDWNYNAQKIRKSNGDPIKVLVWSSFGFIPAPSTNELLWFYRASNVVSTYRFPIRLLHITHCVSTKETEIQTGANWHMYILFPVACSLGNNICGWNTDHHWIYSRRLHHAWIWWLFLYWRQS